MRAHNFTYSLAALMLVLSTSSASAIELVNDRNQEMSTESGRDGGNTSSTSESSVDTSASQTNSSYQASSSADAQFTTQASSFASSESCLVMPSAFPDNPFLWEAGVRQQNAAGNVITTTYQRNPHVGQELLLAKSR